VSAPPGWYRILQDVVCLVEPLGGRTHPQDLNHLSAVWQDWSKQFSWQREAGIFSSVEKK